MILFSRVTSTASGNLSSLEISPGPHFLMTPCFPFVRPRPQNNVACQLHLLILGPFFLFLRLSRYSSPCLCCLFVLAGSSARACAEPGAYLSMVHLCAVRVSRGKRSGVVLCTRQTIDDLLTGCCPGGLGGVPFSRMRVAIRVPGESPASTGSLVGENLTWHRSSVPDYAGELLPQ